MKLFSLVLAAAMLGCNDAPRDTNGSVGRDTPVNSTTLPVEQPALSANQTNSLPAKKSRAASDSASRRAYANQRFRNVTVEKIGKGKYAVKGEGQIFEASFSWVVEDGHDELLGGHEMTDAGAPEWGAFRFTVEAKKKRQNSTLTLVLYEVSAKDGSRQHQLPIALD